MRASELLHSLAELIASAEQMTGGGQERQPQTQQAQPQMVSVDVSNVDATGSNGVFVPPLQAKLELLKKSVNVDNIYDQGGADENLTGDGADNQDEMGRLRKMAGINVTATDEAASDEPLDV